MRHILIIEDESVIRDAVKKLLKRKGYLVSAAESVEQAETEFDLCNFNLILTDVRLPGVPGTEVIKKAPGVPVLIMTSYASVRSAVDSIKQGATDYIAKPFDHDELLLLIERTLKNDNLERKSQILKSEVDKEYPVDGMIGRSPQMQEVFRRVAKVAPTNSTVLILGESGTGKELVARALHEQSHRKDAPIITVNCAAIPETLIESELFGHEKGAFTGAESARTGLVEAAEGGTLFLDEVGELPMAAQARLLRVLQNGEIRRVGSEKSKLVDIRLVAATHRDLKQRVQTSEFRSDLYFRLRVVELTLPALRNRGGDVIELARFMLEKARTQLNRAPITLTPEAIQAITHHQWPGNVRELENAMERAVILCDDDTITADLLAIEAYDDSADSAPPQKGDLSLEDYFRQFVQEHQDQLTETELAKRLGISRKALWERRQRFGIPRAKKGTP